MADSMTFRQQCALVALERLADKVFDVKVQQMAQEAGCDVTDYVASTCWELANAMEYQR